MEWTQVLFIVASNFGMFLWLRSESKEEERRTRSLIDTIKEDMRDFHGRLCAIEERGRR